MATSLLYFVVKSLVLGLGVGFIVWVISKLPGITDDAKMAMRVVIYLIAALVFLFWLIGFAVTVLMPPIH